MEQNLIYEKLQVRLITDDNEQTWFAGIDVCKILGYQDPDAAIRKLDEDERTLTRVLHGSGQTRKTWTVNESGLYSLILTSLKPEAKAFKKWVTQTVLPAIRKAGKYSTEHTQRKEAQLQELRKLIDAKKSELSKRKSDTKELESQIKKLDKQFWETFNTRADQLSIFPAEVMESLKQ
jgi:anti-repressor protein